ncbi:hypothetical protein ACTJJ7_16460 [Phyllobacterium sp. 22229]|uniref:hypothetical protein n=1 Tax=Phyllobacterium sp. 22229 TaxID=3453895 RepID=UPI003F84B192
MNKIWTYESDLHLVCYFETSGEDAMARYLGRTPDAILRRVNRLKGTCAWFELKRLIASEWGYRRNYHIALGQSAQVERIDTLHPGAPDILTEEHGYFPVEAVQ